MRLMVSALLAASTALAQSNGSIAGPVLGMVFDGEAAAVRLIEGIPGAARLGPAVDGASELSMAAVAANRGYALVVKRSGPAAVVTGSGTSLLTGARTGASQTLVSPRGTAAALVFDDPAAIQVFTGMPEAPQLRRTIDLEGAPAAFALSDDGEVVLSVVRSRRGGDVVYSHRDGGPLVFYRARRVAAVAFVPGTHDALIAEPGAVKIVSPDLGQQPAGSDPDGDIAVVAAAPEGSRVFVASRSGRVTIHDLRSGASSSVTCACAPNALAPLRGNAVFRLNESGEGPLWLLDADSPQARISFVAGGGESR